MVHSNADKEYDQLALRIKSKLPDKVYAELEAFSAEITADKFIEIHEVLNRRFERMNDQILAWTEQEEDGQEIEIQEVQRRFFEIANPKEMYGDLQRVFHFTEISRNFEIFLSGMKKNPYGDLFADFFLTDSSYQYLNTRIMAEAQSAFDALELYSSLVKDHFDLIRSEKSARGFKLFVKLIFKGMSFAVLGPMGSIGAGLFVNALFDQKTAIGRSMNEVGEQYDKYEEQLNHSLDQMEAAYRSVLLGLYGGALLKANEALANHHLQINSLNLNQNEFRVKYIDAEEVNTRLWAERQLYIINRKIDEGKWYEVHVMADRFYHYVISKPGMGPILLKNGRSLGRESFLLKYMVVSKIADTLKSQGDPGWSSFVENLLRQLPFTVKKAEAREYGAKLPAEWGMLLVQQALADKKPELVQAYLDYTYRIIRRKMKDWDILEDEQLDVDEVDWNMAFGYAASLLAEGKLKQKHPLQTYHHLLALDRPLALELRSWYLRTAGTDSMSRFLWLLLQSANAAVILKPLQRSAAKTGSFLKDAFHSLGEWMGLHGRKMAKTAVKLAIVLLLLVGGYQFKDEILGTVENLTAEQNEEPGEEVSYADEEDLEETVEADFYAEDGNVEGNEAEETIAIQESLEQHSSTEEAGSVEEYTEVETESISMESTLDENPGVSGNEVESDAVSQDELAETDIPELHIYRLGSVPFKVNGRSFDAFLEEQTAPATDKPYSLIVTEELPDSLYVYSEEILDSQPEAVFATNDPQASVQLLAVTYPDSQIVDIFKVSGEGIIVEKQTVTAENLTITPETITYTDPGTGEIRNITIGEI